MKELPRLKSRYSRNRSLYKNLIPNILLRRPEGKTGSCPQERESEIAPDHWAFIHVSIHTNEDEGKREDEERETN